MPRHLKIMLLFSLSFGILFTVLAYYSVQEYGFSFWTYFIIAVAAYDFFKVYQILTLARKAKKEKTDKSA
ncbi:MULTISPECIES: YdiK family protein [Exiguobacterium]|uniref:YdiK family protein n=1 Tax=Exiguobacterium TaxID=33986 RepID=UPI001BEC77AB|nr:MULTISPECIES: YdiK family protein [Exiguobacterium]MCT4783514.1 YdiK family protein [Exiguobacterium himgiriensis]